MKVSTQPYFIRPEWIVALGILLLGGLNSSSAQTTVPGDYIVTGNFEVQGNDFNLGTWTTDSSKLGLNILYAEDTNQAATLTFTANRPASNWLWQEIPTTGTTKVLQMSLSSNNALTLYDKSANQSPAIILDPVTRSTFQTPVTFNGTDNQMPGQTVTGNASVLTVGLADARYKIYTSGNSVALGFSAEAGGDNSMALGAYSSAGGDNAVALGGGSYANGNTSASLGVNSATTADNTVALGNYSAATGWGASTFGVSSSATNTVATALGAYSSASGLLSIAVGHASNASGSYASAYGIYSSASGEYSTTLGYSSHASGNLSTAIGSFSSASGLYATTLGEGTTSTGESATAMGFQSIASGRESTASGTTEATSMFQFTAGRFNVTGGDPLNWVATDDLFTVGNGQDDTHRSNALSVKKNGDATFQGVITAAPGGDIPMYTGN